jgi:WD40 repeat protein
LSFDDRSGDKSVIVWSATTGQMLARLEGHQRYVTCVAFSADNRLLASGSNDRQVIVWGLSGQSFKRLNDSDTIVGSEMTAENHFVLNRKTSERVQDTSHWQTDNGDDVMHWSIDQVLLWLQTNQMNELQDVFRQQQIDGPKLLHLTHDTLQHKLKIGL